MVVKFLRITANPNYHIYGGSWISCKKFDDSWLLCELTVGKFHLKELPSLLQLVGKENGDGVYKYVCQLAVISTGEYDIQWIGIGDDYLHLLMACQKQAELFD